MNTQANGEPKILSWAGSSKKDLLALPPEVRREFGYALWMFQRGEVPEAASPFELSTANNVLKLSENFDGDTYRCVIAAKFDHAVYVLHVFKKKSNSGIATPQKDIELVYKRLEDAKEDYARMFGTRQQKGPHLKIGVKTDVKTPVGARGKRA